MRPVLAILALLASFCVAHAQGCGPTRLKVSESVTLDLPAATAWQQVGHFQDMSWARNTRATQGSGGDGAEKATRKVTFVDGTVTQDSLYKYDAIARSYSCHIDAVDVAVVPVQNASVTIEVTALDGGAKSKVSWRAAFYRFIKPGESAPDRADAEATKAMSVMARDALDGLKSRSEGKT